MALPYEEEGVQQRHLGVCRVLRVVHLLGSSEMISQKQTDALLSQCGVTAATIRHAHRRHGGGRGGQTERGSSAVDGTVSHQQVE